MSLLSLFVGSDYELRSGWRFGAYSSMLVVLFVATGTVLGTLVAWMLPSWFEASTGDIRLLGLNAIALLVPAAGALIVMAWLVDHAPLAAFGVAVHVGWLRDLGMGVVIAAGMLAVTLAGSLLFGSVQIQWTGSWEAMPSLIGTLAVLAVSAANEELVFRGYPLQVLMKGIGPRGAIILISSIFGLLHARNENATMLSVMNTILAGILLSMAYLKTRSLWLPYGIHIGWNAGLAVFLGFPVSGIETASLLSTHVAGSELILGGGYGPEDGILGTLIFLSGAVAILRLRGSRVSPEIQSALSSYSAKVYAEGL